MEQVGIQLVIRRGDANGKFGMVISNGKHKSLKISMVRKNMAAEAAGVLKNDTVLSMDGSPTSQIWKQAIDMFRSNKNSEVSIQVIPKSKVAQASLEPCEDLIASRTAKGKSWGVEIAQGPGGKAIVTVCKKGSPMEKAGVVPGDMVIGINGNIATPPQFFEVQGLIGDSFLEITLRVSRRFHWTEELYGAPKRRFSRTSVDNDFFGVADDDDAAATNDNGDGTTAAGYMEVPQNAAVSSAEGYMEVPEFMGGAKRPNPDAAGPAEDGGLSRETHDHELAAAIGRADLDSDVEDEDL